MNAQAATDTNETVTPKQVTKAKVKTKTKTKAVYKPRTKRSPVPRTARAYMKTLGQEFDKESVAVTELIKRHYALNKLNAIPAFEVPAVSTPKPPSMWQKYFGKFGK